MPWCTPHRLGSLRPSPPRAVSRKILRSAVRLRLHDEARSHSLRRIVDEHAANQLSGHHENRALIEATREVACLTKPLGARLAHASMPSFLSR